MNRKFFIAFIFIFSFCLLPSCEKFPTQATSVSGSEEEEELNQLSSDEIELITNEENPGSSDGKNHKKLSCPFEKGDRGDTCFGAAIKYGKEEDALFLLEKMECGKHLYHRNHKGESYVFLASKRGYPTLINSIADICYGSQKDWLDGEDYEFSDLDMETKKGDKALHVAANVQVAEAIVYEYEARKGELSSPWSFFYKHTNHAGQTFLHKAALDNRIHIIEWAIKRECSSSENSIWEVVIENIVAWFKTNIINKQDNKNNTALHLAASSRNKEAIHALANCHWVDLSLKNLDGDIPLQSFLKALDSGTHEEALELLKRLIPSDWWLNHQNKDGNSSLHLAAKLSDPSLYNYLKQFGNTALSNNQGNTPEQIFEITQKNFTY